jgi:predicted nucleic acid-binding protein
MIVADTDVLIDFLGEREPAAGRVTRELESGNLWTTVITRFELLSGAKGARELRIVSELLDSIKIAPLDVYAADCVALVRRTLERKGVGIGMADSLIAGIELHRAPTPGALTGPRRWSRARVRSQLPQPLPDSRVGGVAINLETFRVELAGHRQLRESVVGEQRPIDFTPAPLVNRRFALATRLPSAMLFSTSRSWACFLRSE